MATTFDYAAAWLDRACHAQFLDAGEVDTDWPTWWTDADCIAVYLILKDEEGLTKFMKDLGLEGSQHWGVLRRECGAASIDEVADMIERARAHL